MNVSAERMLQELGALYLESKLAQEALAAEREKVKALEEAASGATPNS